MTTSLFRSEDETASARSPRGRLWILAATLAIDLESVSVKATTTEGTGPEGEGLAVTAHAVAVVRETGGDRGWDEHAD